MITVNDFDDLVAARMLDFTRPVAMPWHRRLWSIGNVLLLREALEASEAVSAGALSEQAWKNLTRTAKTQLGPDPGIGGSTMRSQLLGLLSEPIVFESVEYLQLEHLTQDIRQNYLQNWIENLSAATSTPSIERTSRLLTAHCLDESLSGRFLDGWLSEKIGGSDRLTLLDLLAEIKALLEKPERKFDVLLGFENPPASRNATMPSEWRTAGESMLWIRAQGSSTASLNLNGGLLLRAVARDEWTALEHAVEAAERISVRVATGTGRKLRILPIAWIAGHSTPFPLARDRRGVHIKALARENLLYAPPTDALLDNALELAGILDAAPAAPAVAAAWAAIESLLVGPGSRSQRIVAADRLADIVACSFPRAELTTLAYAVKRTGPAPIAAQISSASSNIERAVAMAVAIRDGTVKRFDTRSDNLGLRRMQAVLTNPKKTLQDVWMHVTTTIRRLYRQRNIVLHWGKTDAVCLDATLRTCAPLVGAGFDRLVHAQFVEHVSPLQLAARAAINRRLVVAGDGSPAALLLSEFKHAPKV